MGINIHFGGKVTNIKQNNKIKCKETSFLYLKINSQLKTNMFGRLVVVLNRSEG